MSRQIQLRRGTAAQNDNFTGADGEVTVDTTAKTLRVHDGETLGGTTLAKKSDIPSDIGVADYVVEFQSPTEANGYTWYRKYKSGWVEQGGKDTTGSDAAGKQINFPVPMANSTYCISFAIPSSWNEKEIVYHVRGASRTATSMNVIGLQQQAQYTVRQSVAFTWYICGMAA